MAHIQKHSDVCVPIFFCEKSKKMGRYFIENLVFLILFGSLILLSACDQINELAKQIIPDSGEQYNAAEEMRGSQGTSDKILPCAPKGISTPNTAYRGCDYSINWYSAPNATQYCVNWSLHKNGSKIKEGTSDWIDKLEYKWLLPDETGIMYVNVYAKNSGGQSKSPLAFEVTLMNIDFRLLASFSKATYDVNLYGATDKYVSIGGNRSQWRLVYAKKEGEWSSHTDFWYQIYVNGNNAVIAFRGTPAISIKPAVWGNWIETLSLIFYGDHPQDKRVREEVAKGGIHNYLGTGIRNIYITGHSLGGHLAMICYKEILDKNNGKYEYLVNRVETFNAVGITKNNADFIKTKGNINKIIQHYTCCDIATWASETLGKYRKPNGYDIIKGDLSDKLYFVGEKKQKIIQHIHSKEAGKMTLIDWFTEPITSWTKNRLDEAAIGIDAHAIEHFNPMVVQIK